MFKALLMILPLLFLPGEDAERVGFDILSGFDYEEQMELPESVTKYDGKKVIVGGFTRSYDGESEGLTEFWLISQNCDCEGQPKWTEMIFCTLPEGLSICIDDEPLELEGVLSVGEEREGDYVTSIYRLEVTKIIE